MDHHGYQPELAPRVVACRTLVWALTCCLAGALPAHGQTNLAEVIPNLFGAELAIAPGPGGTHVFDFVPHECSGLGREGIVCRPILESVDPFLTDFRLTTLNQTITEQLATFPAGSAAGGFLYTFNPAVGTFTRASRSFGSSYAERALTGGRGRLALGVREVDPILRTGFRHS